MSDSPTFHPGVVPVPSSRYGRDSSLVVLLIPLSDSPEDGPVPIRVYCAACEYRFRVNSRHQGETIRCPSCSEPVHVRSDGRSYRAPRVRKRSSRLRRSISSLTTTGLLIGVGIVAGLLLFVAVTYFAFRMGQGSSEYGASVATATDPPASQAAVSQSAPSNPIAARVAPTSVATAASLAGRQLSAGTVLGNTPGNVGNTHPSVSPSSISSPRTTTLPPGSVFFGGDVSSAEPPFTSDRGGTEFAARSAGSAADTADFSDIPYEFTSWADLNDLVEPSVVQVNVKTAHGHGNGSGFVLDPSGTIVTNYHVIGGAEKAWVVFANGDQFPVQGYLHLDHRKDIALIRIDPAGATQRLRALPLLIGEARKGSEVAAFGAPLGLSFTFSRSTVSAYRTAEDLHDTLGIEGHEGNWVQHTVPISAGNSGGPLVNKHGQVIAITTMTLTIGQQLNFGISSTDIDEASRNQKNLVPVSPAFVPDMERSHESAGSPSISDNPYKQPGVAIIDSTKTEKGRQLLAKMTSMSVFMIAFDLDPRQTVSGAVKEKARQQIKSSRLEYDYGGTPVLLILMTLEPQGSKHALWITAEIMIEEESTGALHKVWESKEDVGTVATSVLVRGKLTRNLSRDIDNFFRKMRTSIVQARREMDKKQESETAVD